MNSPRKHSLSSSETRTSLSSLIQNSMIRLSETYKSISSLIYDHRRSIMKYFLVAVISVAVIGSISQYIQYRYKIDEIKRPTVAIINRHIQKQITQEKKLLQALEKDILNHKQKTPDFSDKVTGFFFGISLSGKDQAVKEKEIMNHFKNIVISEKNIAELARNFEKQYNEQMRQTQDQLAIELETALVDHISVKQKEVLKRAFKKEFDQLTHSMAVKAIQVSFDDMAIFGSHMLFLSSVITNALNDAIITSFMGTTSAHLNMSTLGLRLMAGGFLNTWLNLFDNSYHKLELVSRLALDSISNQVIEHIHKETKKYRSNIQIKLDDILEEIAVQKNTMYQRSKNTMYQQSKL